jgi:hypothetical protein
MAPMVEEHVFNHEDEISSFETRPSGRSSG